MSSVFFSSQADRRVTQVVTPAEVARAEDNPDDHVYASLDKSKKVSDGRWENGGFRDVRRVRDDVPF